MRYTQPNTMTDKMFYMADCVLQWAHHLFKTNPRDFVDIETCEDNFTLVMKDGTLLTAVAILGSSKYVLENEFEEIIDMVERQLTAYMNDGCHYTSFYFSADPDGILEEVKQASLGARHAAKTLGLDVEDLLDEQEEVLSRYCQKERALLLFWSNNHGMSRDEKRVAAKDRIEARRGLPLANNAQDIGMGVGTLQRRHNSFVSGLCEDLKSVNITTRTWDVHEFLRELKQGYDSEWTPSDWEPCLPGDPVPNRLDISYNADASGALWPSIKEQLITRGSESLSHSTERIGDRVFAPITIDLHPKKPEPFQTLFKRLNRERLPWRMHMLIRQDGMQIFAFKELMASMLRFTPNADENKFLVEVKKGLKARQDNGEEIVKLQIALCTWAPVGDKKLIDKRTAQLARCVQGWGNCNVAPAEGDVLESTMCTLPGAVIGSVANIAAAPIYDALKMSPLTRPGSPWESGAQLFRTKDGKLMPYQPYSKLQASWITLIFGPMGYGKTSLMNDCHLSLILSPQCDELPFISQIDIGPGMRGLISLIRSGLSREKRHLVIYERLTNTLKHAINVFDTHLGLRKPLSSQKSFLINFLSFLATADNEELPVDGVTGMANQLIELAYKRCSERTTAKKYQPKVLKAIDELLKTLSFEPSTRNTLWWDVVDFLHKNGHTHEASLAQRYAVPNLSDILAYCNDERSMAVYGNTKNTNTHENMPYFFFRKLTEAISIYPIISTETKFDLGEARIVSLDLDEVARGHGADSKRKTGLMYMVAYQILTQRFFLGSDSLLEMDGEVGRYNVDYRPYHEKVIKALARLPKRFSIDEKHRIKGLHNVESQIDTSIVEGRKWNVEIMQASQLPDDFSKNSVDLATSIFILGAGSASNIAAVTKTFRLSPTMVEALTYEMRIPCVDGQTFLAIMDTEKGSFQQHLMATKGPTFLWATNSHRDDSYVRDVLATEIGTPEARRLLTKMFPSGGLRDEIKRRKKVLDMQLRKEGYQGEDLSGRDEETDAAPKGILSDIIKECLARYKARKGIRRERLIA